MYSENAFRMSHGPSFGENKERLAFVTKASLEQLVPRAQTSQRLPRQLVTLGFLSDRLPASLISEQLAKSLCGETDADIVLVRLKLQAETPVAGGSSLPDAFLNGEFHLPSEIRRAPAGFHALTLGVERQPSSPAAVESLVGQLCRLFRHVLIEIPGDERLAAWVTELAVRADLAFLFLPPTTEAAYRLESVTRSARTQWIEGDAQIKPIVCLAEGEPINDFDTFVQRLANPAHMFVRGCPVEVSASDAATASLSRAFKADARRLARAVAGRLVGLALSSGAAKGFTHIGVIQVLEEQGIEVDVVAGSSMGAYIGALWAYGLDGRELERLAREMESRWALWSLIDPVFPPRQGFLRGLALKRRLMRSIGAARFADLARPLRVVAGDLETLDRMVFSSGEVAAAVHASIAVPGVCVPVAIDGASYIDGGVVDPLPVDLLREMGVSRIIAVDAIPTPDRIRRGLVEERARARETPRRRFFRKVLPVNQQLNYFARGNLFEILMRSVQGAQIRMAEASCRLADVVLRPDIFDDRWLDCAHPGRFIVLGRKVAEQQLEEIQALVAKKEGRHEREPIAASVAAAA
jgi:NTE family protein